MNARADLPTSFRREIGGRGLMVLFLFGLTLFLLYSANLIEVPTSGIYDPETHLFNVAFGSSLAMVCVAIPQRGTRRLLAVLLGSLGLFLLCLDLAGLNYRFISESDEGESAMLLIGVLTAAAILWALPAFNSSGARAGINRQVRYAGLRQYAGRVLWSTESRKALSITVALVYAIALVMMLVGGEWDDMGAGSGSSDLREILLLAAISIGAGLLGSRAGSRTLKSMLWVVSALFAIFLLLATELGFFLMVMLLHASLAFAAFAASAAAVDARDSNAKVGFALLAAAMAIGWVALALFGAFMYALGASGYYS